MDRLLLLSRREKDVLLHLALGLQNKEIAKTLGIAEHTVEQHLQRVYRKLEVSNRFEAAILYTWRSLIILTKEQICRGERKNGQKNALDV